MDDGPASGLNARHGLHRDRRWDRRWLAVAAVTLFALCAAYQLPGARHLMLALPVVRRGLHHYIKLGLELGLALLAAAGLDGWIAGRRRALLAGAEDGICPSIKFSAVVPVKSSSQGKFRVET